ncbi:MAG: ABC transporter transmembrane domain-containing protein, partial [Pseudomonadota bacterium]
MSASDPESRPSSASQALSELTTGPAPTQWELIERLWQDQVRRYLPILIIALVLMLIEGASLGAFAWLIQPLFDGLFANDTMDGVAWIAALIAGLFVLRAATGFVQRMLVVSVGLRVSNNLQREMVAHMLTLDQRFFQDNSPGALIERVRGDTLALRRLASNTLISVGRDSFTLLSLVTVMLFNDWVWTLTALVGIPLLIVPLFVLFRFIRSTSHETRTVAGRLTVRLDEIFHGIQTIKLNRLEQSEDTRFAKELKRFL